MGSVFCPIQQPAISGHGLRRCLNFRLSTLGIAVGHCLSNSPVLAQSWSIPSPEVRIAQGLSAPSLDDSLNDFRATFTQITTPAQAIIDAEIGTSSPAYAIVNPTGYGSSFGTIFFAAGGVFEGRNQQDGNAGLGVGVGLGDATNLLGVDISYTISNLEEELGGANVKLHRALYSDSQIGVSVAVGFEDLLTTGDIERDPTTFASTSIIFRTRPNINDLFSRLAVTLGVGNGRFRRERDILQDKDTVSFFGSGAVRVTPSLSVISEWTGQDVAAGLSVAPFSDVNFYITPALRDIAGDGDGARFSLGAGLSFKF